MNKKQKKMLKRIIVASILFIMIKVAKLPEYIEIPLFLVAYLEIGYDILLKAFKGIRNRQVFDENFLMAVATVGAIGLKSFDEATAVMLFYQIGEWFQSYAVGKSRKNITELMDIRPDYANVEDEDGNLEQVDPDEVEIGTIIVVKPGEKVAIDGIVVEGSSTLNTAALTGESLPREVSENDKVISGCINMTGLLKIKTTKEFGESTVSKILDLVENASSKKSRSEAFISRFARIYTPVVCYSALALFLLPPVFNLIISNPADFGTWLYRALTFLVISCPCALVISIPLSFFAGIGGASNQGVLVKGSNYLEALASCKYVVFDKTGTMTQGVFEVAGIHHATIPEEKLLEYAAMAESYSTHPISKSLLKAYGNTIDKSRIENVEEISGHGVKAVIDGVQVLAGNDKLMKMYNIPYQECHSVGTIVHMAIDDKYAGHIVISDMLKPHAKEAIEALKKAGIKQTVMLTGDVKSVADKVASELHIDKVYSELLPQDKVNKVEELLSLKQPKENLAFVGDGINDAPALARADVGIAIGAGTDVAIESADAVLMRNDLMDAVTAIRLSKAVIRNIKENLFWAFFYNCIGIPLAAGAWIPVFGWTLNPMFGAAAMSLSSFCVVTNALRLNLIKIYDTGKDHIYKKKSSKNKNKTTKGDKTMTKTMNIEGMMCGHCEAAVKKALEAVDGVTEAVVSHENGTAVVTLSKEVDNDVLKKAVEDKDYKVTAVK